MSLKPLKGEKKDCGAGGFQANLLSKTKDDYQVVIMCVLKKQCSADTL